MTEKRFWLVPMDYYGEQRFVRDNTLIGEKSMSNQEVVDLLNEQEGMVQRLNQEITACYDTLTTIEELCDAVLNHDFEGVVSKVDFCNMLIEMDNKDLAFLKECFEAIRDNDLKTMTSLKLECKYGDDVNES